MKRTHLLSFAPLSCLITALAALSLSGCGENGGGPPTAAESPILFVTQTPFHSTFDMVTGVFGNHHGVEYNCPRGGDLMILYPDGKLRSLTEEAGFGVKKFEEIAVREPAVSWDGKRALFSMVIGGTAKDDLAPYYWQIYEVSGLGEDETVHIERVPNQPEEYNNVSPTYGTDGRIIFTTDRPRGGDRRLYPQLDEYESVEIVTGLWSFDPKAPGGDLRILSHVPSGAFSPKVALDGRVMYVRWDHLQRDQQWYAEKTGQADYGTFDFVSETSDDRAANVVDNFPEWIDEGETPSGYHRHIFNQFFPWQINEDGTGEETLNHVGRQEIVGYVESLRDDLPYHSSSEAHPPITNFIHLMEDPHEPGTFYGTNPPEFGTHASGEIVAIKGPIGLNPDDMYPIHITNPATYEAPESGSGSDEHSGRYRNPVPLSDGSLIAAYSQDPRSETQEGDGRFGNATYRFRLHHLVREDGGEYFVAGAPLTGGITKTVSYFDNQAYKEDSYQGEMWELDPVEVAPRPMPTTRKPDVPDLERGIIEQAMQASGGYDALRAYLTANNLALLVSRDVTRRADMQQPYNLEVPGGARTVEDGGKAEQIQYIQFFQADQVRAYAGHREGRRPVAREMHDAPDGGESAAGAFRLATDGSFAAVVPAGRAMTWQLTSPENEPVVRERYWVTFAPGEVRVCGNCHGINTTDVVMGEPPPENPPEALAPFLKSLFE